MYEREGVQYPYPFQLDGEKWGILLTRADMEIPSDAQLREMPLQLLANFLLRADTPRIAIRTSGGMFRLYRKDLERVARGGDPSVHRRFVIPVGSVIGQYPFDPPFPPELERRLRTAAAFGHANKVVAAMLSINYSEPRLCLFHEPTPNHQFEWISRKVWEDQTVYNPSLITMPLDAMQGSGAESILVYERPSPAGSASALPDDVDIHVAPVTEPLPEGTIADFRELGMRAGLNKLAYTMLDVARAVELYCFTYDPFPCDAFYKGIEAIKAKHGLIHLNTPMMPWVAAATGSHTVIFET